MSRPELSLFSYEVMGLVGRGGAGPHDLLRMARRGRLLDWAGESQYYVEPKRLAGLGYLEARQEPGRTRPRTVYSLTGSFHLAAVDRRERDRPQRRQALGQTIQSSRNLATTSASAARADLHLHRTTTSASMAWSTSSPSSPVSEAGWRTHLIGLLA